MIYQVKIRFSSTVMLEFSCEKLDSKVIYCDKSRLQQIFLALLTNAFKFSQCHGDKVYITVKLNACEMSSKMLTIKVENNGVGIEQNEVS